MKKSIITIFGAFSLLILCTPVPVKAQSNDTVQTHIEYLDTGCYYETTITNDNTEAFISPFATTKYITKAKTTKYKMTCSLLGRQLKNKTVYLKGGIFYG